MFEGALVTGGTGFVGQRLLEGLKRQGAKIRVISRSPHPKYETVVCDLVS